MERERSYCNMATSSNAVGLAPRRPRWILLLLLLLLRATGLSLQQGKVVAAAALGASLCMCPVYAEGPLDGAKLFDQNCAVCHTGGGNLIVPSKSLDRTALNENGFDRANIEVIITRGRDAMPGFGCTPDDDVCAKARLGQDDIATIAQYVDDQANNDWR